MRRVQHEEIDTLWLRKESRKLGCLRRDNKCSDSKRFETESVVRKLKVEKDWEWLIQSSGPTELLKQLLEERGTVQTSPTT